MPENIEGNDSEIIKKSKRGRPSIIGGNIDFENREINKDHVKTEKASVQLSELELSSIQKLADEAGKPLRTFMRDSLLKHAKEEGIKVPKKSPLDYTKRDDSQHSR